MSQLTFTGTSGKKHVFSLHLFNGTYPDAAGVYAVMNLTATKYVGQAGNVRQRHTDHEHYDDFVAHGATHLAFLLVTREDARQDIESDLIAFYNPPINKKK